jgi:hypothetical protein
MIPSTGSSISGPITSASDIKGSCGKAVSAIARTIGELRASVVRLRLAVSWYEKPMYLPIICPTMNTITKNSRTGVMSFSSIRGFWTSCSPWEANMEMIARFKNRNCTCSSFGNTFFSSQYSPFSLGTTVFETREKIKGMNRTRITLFISRAWSIVAIDPAKSKRYSGNNNSWRIRFIGRMDADRGTLPRAIPVKSKYQSVQGVTMSIIKPIHNAGVSLKNKNPRENARIGLNMKLMPALMPANLQFLKEFLSCLRGTCKKIPNNITIRKGTMKRSA